MKNTVFVKNIRSLAEMSRMLVAIPALPIIVQTSKVLQSIYTYIANGGK